MAKQITHISVFLASPSDLAEERIAVRQVIDELNMIVRPTMNIHLDLLTWETDAYPSAGIDAQYSINEQIGNEYDIFIGMMWQRFGTPTGRAGSGTEEEFEIAYKRFVETEGQTKIMLYFSAKPIQPDAIDFEQLGKVREFKTRAQTLGILHWSFSDADSFQKMLKIHLIKQISDVIDSPISSGNKLNNINSIAAQSTAIVKQDDSDDENGYFDLMEIFSENFSQVESVLTKMAGHIEELGMQMNRKAAKIDAVNKSPKRSPHSYRILIDSSAADITNYVDLTAVELPRFHDLFTTGIDAFSNALTISETNGSKMEVSEIEELLEGIAVAKANVEEATDSIIGFRGIAGGIPLIAKTINKATRLLHKTLSNVVDEFNNSVVLLNELQVVVHSILMRSQDGESGVEEA